MKIYTSLLFALLFLIVSCKDNENIHRNNTLRAEQHTDSVFALLNEKWDFIIPDLPKDVKLEIAQWKQWEEFTKEISIKPVASLGAFQKKTKKLSDASHSLHISIPVNLNKPEIRARITVLNNTFNNLQMYLDIKPIPYEKIDELLPQINTQLNFLIDKMDELMEKKSVPKEIGEEEMLRALDTIRRANPIY